MVDLVEPLDLTLGLLIVGHEYFLVLHVPRLEFIDLLAPEDVMMAVVLLVAHAQTERGRTLKLSQGLIVDKSRGIVRGWRGRRHRMIVVTIAMDRRGRADQIVLEIFLNYGREKHMSLFKVSIWGSVSECLDRQVGIPMERVYVNMKPIYAGLNGKLEDP